MICTVKTQGDGRLLPAIGQKDVNIVLLCVTVGECDPVCEPFRIIGEIELHFFVDIFLPKFFKKNLDRVG